MQHFKVTGMSCTACSARVERVVSAIPGVETCRVSLLDRAMVVEGSATPEQIIAAVDHAGYHAKLASISKFNELKSNNNDECKILLQKFIYSCIFLIFLLIVSMGPMFGFIPPLLGTNFVACGVYECLLSTIIAGINRRFFSNGFLALRHRAPNMDTLVALGASASWLYSSAVLIGAMTGTLQTAHAHYYFESTGMILTLITLGKYFETRAKGKTTSALQNLVDLAPKTARIVRHGQECETTAEQLKEGDIFVVRAGESFPADGIVVEGHSAVDESPLTGECLPVEKKENDSVAAATINTSGLLKCRATHVGESTLLANIIKTVQETSASKAPIARTADKLAAIFVPIVLAIAVGVAAVWFLLSHDIEFSIARGISVLVISCPCALGLATPVAIMVGSGIGANHGILFKSAASLEELARVQCVAFDKTGTLTMGTPQVTDVLPHENITENRLLQAATDIENASHHPLAKAIQAYAQNKGFSPNPIRNFAEIPGKGLRATTENAEILHAGNLNFIQENLKNTKFNPSKIQSFEESGKSLVYFAINGVELGCIALSDTVRKETAHAIRILLSHAITPVMLTGDNEKTALSIAAQIGIAPTHVHASLLPNDKAKMISEIQKHNACAMVGDGINDAPALTTANIGIAIANGTDIALQAANIVLLKPGISAVPTAILISRRVLRIIRQNLFWAFFYNIVGIPIAAGALMPFGLVLTPGLCALAMSLSSFCVVSNALRLYFLLKPRKGDKK